MKIFNPKNSHAKRRNLRQNQTDAERILWSRLRNKQFYGIKFFRQYGIGSYICDFYCPKFKLAIEIDGGQHFTSEGKQHDSRREQLFVSLGIRTIRFTNLDILNQLVAVLEKIISELPPTPSL